MSMQSMPLFFQEPVLSVPIETLIANALGTLGALFAHSVPCVIAFSGGKDSSTIANLVLTAAKKAALEGHKPFVVATTSDTLVENPEAQQHYRRELGKMSAFARANNIRFHAEIVTPNLASTWQVSILSGRALPSWPGGNTNCSVDLKINSQITYRNKLFRELRDERLPEPVTILGTRLDESQRRAAKMKKRRESAIEPTRNATGDLVLSPLAYWQTDDVWEYIGMCASGLLDTFSDFAETMRIYAHSGGTSCAVVADSLLEGKQKKGGCGARLGCYVCQQAVDKSLENMIDYDEQYAYARGLNLFNKFIRATRFDYTRRHWVGRTIKEGFLCVEPDTYHPKMLRMLTRFMLQLDYDEMRRAERAGEPRKFVILPMEMMIAVDALQSMNGVARPFSIWADYRDIFFKRVRYDIPVVETTKATAWPTPKFLYVGKEWDSSAPATAWTGMRDPYYEAMTEGSGCNYDIRTLSNGRTAWDVPTEQAFSVDPESAFMISEFELDHLIDYYDRCTRPGDVTFAYRWYLQYGAITLQHSQASSHDEALRRTAFKDRLGLTLNYDIDDLVGRALPYADLPEAARLAWKDKKTATAFQDDMFHLAA